MWRSFEVTAAKVPKHTYVNMNLPPSTIAKVGAQSPRHASTYKIPGKLWSRWMKSLTFSERSSERSFHSFSSESQWFHPHSIIISAPTIQNKLFTSVLWPTADSHSWVECADYDSTTDQCYGRVGCFLCPLCTLYPFSFNSLKLPTFVCYSSSNTDVSLEIRPCL